MGEPLDKLTEARRRGLTELLEGWNPEEHPEIIEMVKQLAHSLLADDERLVAFPGPARLKLFPEMARIIFGDRALGVRMNPLTPKSIIFMDQAQCCAESVPLRSLYVLDPPGEHEETGTVRIRALSSLEAFVHITQNTFNSVVHDTARLRQQFSMATCIARSVPVYLLSYPRTARNLMAVRDAVLLHNSHKIEVSPETVRGPTIATLRGWLTQP